MAERIPFFPVMEAGDTLPLNRTGAHDTVNVLRY